ncbi:hypothetical protein EH223_02595 [candidate division KSB1 bacterium]|nr:hypothetical protein [candidate division KSB1 bacterium]RQW06285.1 MAG: hypothetical protein EH223_02595 [candidate division KSB1 bacterium]
MAKKIILSLVLLLLTTMLYAYDRLNPPYPRTASYSLGQNVWPTYSIGTRLLKLARYDMAYIYGSVDDNGTIKAKKLRQLNPDQILIAMGLNGIFFSDPPEYYLYRSYRGNLLEDVLPGQRAIRVDNTDGINLDFGDDYRLCYAVINNDIINIYDVIGDTLFAPSGGDDFWKVNQKHVRGDSVLSPLRMSGPGIFPNFSQWCPPVNGKYLWDYLAEKNLLEKIDWTEQLWDGLFHDAFYANVYLKSQTMDMNLNGIDDYVEMGSTPDKAGQYSINPHRREYIAKWLDRENVLMDQLDPNAANMLGVNNGGTCEYFYEQMNGHTYEGFGRWADWFYLKDDCLAWMEENKKRNRPSMMFIEDYIPEKWVENGKDRFDKMLYGLTTALLFDCYYGMTFGDWYYIMFWYDEFETNLGYGIGLPFELPNGLWARYFDKGVAISNPTGQIQTVSPADLDGRTYYRLRGGQNPELNNGEQFIAPIEVYAHTYGTKDVRGGGIILFTEPVTAVTDIIIDNFYNNDTSPGNNPVELQGDWSRYVTRGDLDWDANNPYWSQFGNKQVVGGFDDAYGYHAIENGGGEATAVWRPSIGVPGYYEIAEWHGWHGDYQSSFGEATDVPFQIIIDQHIRLTGTIDQTAHYGQWNILGNFYCPKGQDNYVKITNKANGWVIADAVRFRFLGDVAEPDTIPPEPPDNLKIWE